MKMTREPIYDGAFGANLDRLLGERGISQASFAEKLGVSAATISCYVHGVRRPAIDKLNDIARILDVTPSDLLAPISEKGGAK